MSIITLNISGKELKKSNLHIRETIKHVSAVQDAKRGLMRKMLMYQIADDIRVLSDMPGLTCIADTQGYFIWVKPEWVDVLGWSEDELINTQFIDFVHPDDVDETTERYRAMIDDRENVTRFTNRYRHKEGHYVNLEWYASIPNDEGFIHAIAHPIKD